MLIEVFATRVLRPVPGAHDQFIEALELVPTSPPKVIKGLTVYVLPVGFVHALAVPRRLTFRVEAGEDTAKVEEVPVVETL
ncbi:hypothetical protein D3C80_1089090 [compost metagenome]